MAEEWKRTEGLDLVIGTEQSAINEERKENEWQENYGKKVPALLEKMNQLLLEKSEDAVSQLIRIFLEPDMLDNYKYVVPFANMYVVMDICQREIAAGMKQTILMHGQTVQELSKFLFRMKAIFYRLEFHIGAAIDKQFLLFLLKNQVSVFAIDAMMDRTVINPFRMAFVLENLFRQHQLDMYEKAMLCYIDRHWEGNCRIRFKLNPSNCAWEQKLPGITDEERDVMLMLQELIWKFSYHQGSGQEIAAYLRENKVSDKVWAFLIKEFPVSDTQLYFQIVNALLELNLFNKTKTVLHYILERLPGDELALCLMADIYIQEEKPRIALDYLEKVVNPTDLSSKLKSVCSK